jgi:hypothetical protein
MDVTPKRLRLWTVWTSELTSSSKDSWGTMVSMAMNKNV